MKPFNQTCLHDKLQGRWLLCHWITQLSLPLPWIQLSRYGPPSGFPWCRKSIPCAKKGHVSHGKATGRLWHGPVRPANEEGLRQARSAIAALRRQGNHSLLWRGWPQCLYFQGWRPFHLLYHRPQDSFTQPDVHFNSRYERNPWHTVLPYKVGPLSPQFSEKFFFDNLKCNDFLADDKNMNHEIYHAGTCGCRHNHAPSARFAATNLSIKLSERGCNL